MATNISDKTQRNQLNIAIRSQPWYQAFFRSKGLDPNRVQLSKPQQQELQQLVVSKGFLDPSDGHIDPAGNVSDFHGWKGLPTAAKVAIVAGAGAVGGYYAAPYLAGAGGASGGTATVGSTLGVPTLAAVNTGAPIVAAGAGAGVGTGVGVGTGTTVSSLLGTGLTTRQIVQSALTPALNAGMGYLTQRSQGKQADRALTAELAAGDRAATLQAQSAREQLEFLKKSEADRLAEARRVEQLNLGQFNMREDRLNPYRQIGLNALTRFGQPISVGSTLGM